MNFADYVRQDGTALAELIAAGDAEPQALLETAIARAEAVNPRLGAIVHPLYQRARERLRAPLSGPFSGVPFLVKDLFQDMRGAPASYGCRALKDAAIAAEEDQEYVRRVETAGAVIFGRTNTPEFGAKGITEPDAWPPARNPWNPDHTPGGSSGGSAAAVAAGIVPAAGANDGGGSIRIPAACCGLFGLKPSRGRTPSGPPRAELMHGAAVNGVVSRSVRDSAAWLDVLAGAESGAGYRLAPARRPYVEAAAEDPPPLRIAYATQSPIGTEVHPEAVAAVENTCALLESLGHRVEPAAPALDGALVAKDFLTMWFAQLAAIITEVKAQTGSGNRSFELDTRAMAALGHALRADEYVAGHNRWQGYALALAHFYADYDLYLTPTLALPPARIGEIATPKWQHAALKVLLALRAGRLLLKSGVVDQMVHENLRWVPYTQLANLTGTPAMSVPLHWCQGGLPLGVQFMAPVGEEDRLFALAGQLERAQPWFDRRPEL